MSAFKLTALAGVALAALATAGGVAHAQVAPRVKTDAGNYILPARGLDISCTGVALTASTPTQVDACAAVTTAVRSSRFVTAVQVETPNSAPVYICPTSTCSATSTRLIIIPANTALGALYIIPSAAPNEPLFAFTTGTGITMASMMVIPQS